MIAKRLMNEEQVLGLRADFEACFVHPLIEGIAWAEHHPVLAENHRLPISIPRYVPDG
jgi:hypothetical protein